MSSIDQNTIDRLRVLLAESRAREGELVAALEIVKREIQHKHGPWKCDPPCYSHQILAILKGE